MAIDFVGPVIGVLDSTELPVGDYQHCLCERELDQCSRIRNIRRRNEWLAGRIAAKFLFLERQQSSRSSASRDLHLFKINSSTLDRVRPDLFRQVAVALPDPVDAGARYISWRSGGSYAERVAISHTNGLACVSVGNRATRALDVETSQPRVASFYERTFTRREKNWVNACAGRYLLDPQWVYTLLWSMKECMLKTRAFTHLTIWNLPSLEIRVLTGSKELRVPHDAGVLQENFVYLETEVSDGEKIMPARMAVSGTADLVLTASIEINEGAM